jgi:hypothetical protein
MFKMIQKLRERGGGAPEVVGAFAEPSEPQSARVHAPRQWHYPRKRK